MNFSPFIGRELKFVSVSLFSAVAVFFLLSFRTLDGLPARIDNQIGSLLLPGQSASFFRYGPLLLTAIVSILFTERMAAVS